MMRCGRGWWSGLVLAVSLLVAGAAAGQTDTPTATNTATQTQTSTSTSTATPTATPTLVFVNGSGFEDYGSPELTFGGACTTTTTGCRTGNRCYRANPTAAVCNARLAASASGQKRVNVWIKGATFDEDQPLVSVESTGAVVALARDGDDKLAILLGEDAESLAPCAVSTPTMDEDVGYRLDLRVVPESSPGADDGLIAARLVNGETQVALDDFGCAGSVGSGTGNQTVRLGSTVAATQDVTFDDLFVADASAYAGDVRWVPVRPTADSTCNASIYTEAGAQEERFRSIDESPHDGESTYIRNAANVAQSCRFSLPAASAASPAIAAPIFATRLSAACKQTTDSPVETVTLLIGSSAGSPANLSDAFATYQRTTAIHPVTIAPWVPDDIEDTAVGVTFSAAQGGVYPLCSALQLNVASVAFTPTATRTVTNTPTSTVTPTVTATVTATRTVTATATATATPTVTSTRTSTATATAIFTYTVAPTRTEVFTHTVTPTVTATGTATSTSTATATSPPSTATPIPMALARNATCASPPCMTACRKARFGTKRITMDKTAGTMSLVVLCLSAGGSETIDTFTDDDHVEFTDTCEEVCGRVDACSSCTYSLYFRSTAEDIE